MRLLSPKRSLRKRGRLAYRVSRRWLHRHWWLAAALVVAGIALVAFAEFVDEINESTLPGLDLFILDVLRPYRSDLIHDIAVHLSDLFRAIPIVLLSLPFVIYLAYARHRRVLIALVAVPIGTMLMVLLMKLAFSRQRPMTAVVEEWGHSFPSGHATGATVIYGLLGYVVWRFMVHSRWARITTIVVTFALILATGLARIYLEVHYPSDVAAGWAAGTFILVGTLIWLETWPSRRRR